MKNDNNYKRLMSLRAISKIATRLSNVAKHDMDAEASQVDYMRNKIRIINNYLDILDSVEREIVVVRG